MLNKVLYLISIGDAVSAGEWARKLAKQAFSENYTLRVYSFDNVKGRVENVDIEWNVC